jgi:hypothetical protein
VVVSQPRSEAFAVAKRHTGSFLSISSSCSLPDFSPVQIPQERRPLAVLKGDPAHQRGISTAASRSRRDEFEDLARSFNTMADHLGKESRPNGENSQNDLGTLTALARAGTPPLTAGRPNG